MPYNRLGPTYNAILLKMKEINLQINLLKNCWLEKAVQMRKYRLGKSVLYNTKKSTNLKRMPNFYNIKYLDPRLFLKEWHVDGFADRMVSRSLLLLATLILWPRSLLFVATVFLYPRFLLFLLFLYSPAPPIKSFKNLSCEIYW